MWHKILIFAVVVLATLPTDRHITDKDIDK